MSQTGQLATTIIVGRYEVEMAIELPYGERGSIACLWSPERPESLTPAELQQYRQGRARFMDELARIIGGGVVVLEC